jgi:acetoin utilization protein AcuB
MSTKIVTIEINVTLKSVKEIFDSTQFHHLLIINSNKLWGLFLTEIY